MPDGQYTRPERAAELGIARRQIAAVYRVGGCGACKHAIAGWGKSVCSQASKTFPRCLSTPGTQFEIDHDKIKQGIAHAPKQ